MGSSNGAIETNGSGTVQLAKKQGFNSFSSWKLALLVVMVLTTCCLKYGWDTLMATDIHHQFFTRKSEFLFMRSMSKWQKWILLKTPFLADDVKRNLEYNPKGHVSVQEFYDPAKHDNVHRGLVENLLTSTECARLRSLLLRNSLRKGVYDEASDDIMLDLEFSALSLFELLGVYDSTENVNILPEEESLLKSVLERVQEAAENKFNDPNLILEFSDITVRRNPIAPGEFWRNLHYLTTGGHPLHSDQCATTDSPQDYWESFECEMEMDHCCAHRTHSVLLYLNDANDDSDLIGGDLFLADRHDLLKEDQPSYAGLGFARQLEHTVRVPPTCGTLIMFASDARNLHGTFPIQRGERFAMPMWFTSPKDLPWHEEDLLRAQMEASFWPNLYRKCQHMGHAIPVPTGLKPHLEDCEEMVEHVKEMAGWNE